MAPIKHQSTSSLSLAAALVSLAAVCGTLVALGHAIPALMVGVVAAVGSLALTNPERVAKALLITYLVPLFAFGRDFAQVGVYPFFLPDVLLVGAVIVAIPLWRTGYRDPQLRLFRVLTVLVAVMAAQSVYRGLRSGYPDALKGMVVVIYPLLSAPIAAWFAARLGQLQKMLRPALFAPTIGTALLLASGRGTGVAASVGLYLSIAVCFGLLDWWRRRSYRLLLACAVGSALLMTGGKRGPILAIVVATITCHLVGRRWRGNLTASLGGLVVGGSLLILFLVFLLGVSPSRWPIVGHVAARVESGLHAPTSEAAANLALRAELWRYSLTTAIRDGPLAGVGFGRPFAITFLGHDISQRQTGPHNSIVGVAYYAGYPAAAAVVAIFAVTFRRLWARRKDLPEASALIGAMAGALVIMLFNVALETSYIGGPIWILLGISTAASMSPMSADALKSAALSELDPMAAKRPSARRMRLIPQ